MSQNQRTIVRLLTASSLSMLACAGLGAFGGCTHGLLEAARAGRQIVSEMILLGVIVGLLVGLAAAFWDKSWARKPSPVWRRFTLRFGFASAWLLIAILPFRVDWSKVHIWTPVNVPLRFDRTNTVSGTFTAIRSDTYKVQIDLKRNLPFEDLNAFTGGWADPADPPHPGPRRPEIVWTVTNVPDAERFTYWRDEYWGETVGLKIGEFKAVAGQRYTVTARVVKPSPAVQVLDPHLQIAPTHILAHYYAPAIYAQIGGLIAGGIGLCLMLQSLSKLRAEQKENQREQADIFARQSVPRDSL